LVTDYSNIEVHCATRVIKNRRVLGRITYEVMNTTRIILCFQKQQLKQ